MLMSAWGLAVRKEPILDPRFTIFPVYNASFIHHLTRKAATADYKVLGPELLANAIPFNQVQNAFMSIKLYLGHFDGEQPAFS